MLIPIFKISQDNDHVIIIIKVPYVKISKSEFYIESKAFKFFLHPYLLNLTFQQELKDAEDPISSVYNYETYELTVKLLKKNKGEHFEDLNMLTKVLNKSEKKIAKLSKKKVNKNPLIQVLNEQSSFKEEEKNDSNDINSLINTDKNYKYGFNKAYSGYFEDLQEEILEIGDLNPDDIAEHDRKHFRDKILLQNFDDEHYLFDQFDNEEEIDYKMKLKLEITKPIKNTDNQEEIYDQKEWDCLTKLPNKQYIIEDKQKIFNQIVDISFAYLYELRVFDDEFSCESQQTINKLSGVLSSFTEDQTVQETLIQNYKRALVYPLLRSFDLCKMTQISLFTMLQYGKINILKLFLRLKNMFDVSEPKYLLNQLYIEDLCIMIQNLKDEDFINLSKEVRKINVTKGDLEDFSLEKIEKAAEMIMGDGEELNEELVRQQLEKLGIETQQNNEQQQQQQQKPLIEEISEQTIEKQNNDKNELNDLE